MGNLIHVTDLAETFSLGNEMSVYVKKQASVGTYELPASTDLVLINGGVNLTQSPDLAESAARVAGTRDPQSQIEGQTDHAESDVTFDWRPPAALSGSSVPMGAAILEGIQGTQRIVNGQQAFNILLVDSCSLDYIELRINNAYTNWTLGDLVRFTSNNAVSDKIEGRPAAVIAITDMGSGYTKLRLEPGLPVRPVLTGTPDQIQGGVVWVMDSKWPNRYSVTAYDGFDMGQNEGSVFHSLEAAFDRRNIFTLKTKVGIRKKVRNGTGHVRGVAGVDALATTDTTLDLISSTPWDVGAYVNLQKTTVATDVIAATETQAQVTAVNRTSTPPTFTLTRGTSPVSSSDLVAITSSQEVAAAPNYNTTTKNVLRLEIDYRGVIDVALTVGANIPPATIAADINAALRDTFTETALYGTYQRKGITLAWGGVASVVSSKIRLTSQTTGSQSRIRVINTGLSSSAHDLIFTGAFDISATDEILVVPWTPGGTETRQPIHGSVGYSTLKGAFLPTASISFTADNKPIWQEDVRTNDEFPAGVIPSIKRTLSAKVKVPAENWTENVEYMASSGETTHLCSWAGVDVGTVFVAHMHRVRIGRVSKSGDERRERDFDVMPYLADSVPALILGCV